jgi:hypothetical protein
MKKSILNFEGVKVLTKKEQKSINGSGRVHYSISVGNPDGSRNITYVWFDDVNNNFTWDPGEAGGTTTVRCPRPSNMQL